MSPQRRGAGRDGGACPKLLLCRDGERHLGFCAERGCGEISTVRTHGAAGGGAHFHKLDGLGCTDDSDRGGPSCLASFTSDVSNVRRCDIQGCVLMCVSTSFIFSLGVNVFPHVHHFSRWKHTVPWHSLHACVIQTTATPFPSRTFSFSSSETLRALNTDSPFPSPSPGPHTLLSASEFDL